MQCNKAEVIFALISAQLRVGQSERVMGIVRAGVDRVLRRDFSNVGIFVFDFFFFFVSMNIFA